MALLSARCTRESHSSWSPWAPASHSNSENELHLGISISTEPNLCNCSESPLPNTTARACLTYLESSMRSTWPTYRSRATRRCETRSKVCLRPASFAMLRPVMVATHREGAVPARPVCSRELPMPCEHPWLCAVTRLCISSISAALLPQPQRLPAFHSLLQAVSQ